MFYSHPFESLSSSTSFERRPITLSAENFNALFCNIHSFDYSISSQAIDTYPNYLVGGITDAVNALNAENDRNSTGFETHVGVLTRKIIDNTQEEDVDVIGQSPVFTNGLITIDMSRAIRVESLYAPKIEITFSNGFSSLLDGYEVGAITFGSFGQIPISSNGEFGVAQGSISPRAYYDTLHISPLKTKINTTVRVSVTNANFQGLSAFTDVRIGAAKCLNVVATESELTFTVPPYAKTDYITFLSYNPFNKFRSVYPLTILS
jgi:hypothetical protein